MTKRTDIVSSTLLKSFNIPVDFGTTFIHSSGYEEILTVTQQQETPLATLVETTFVLSTSTSPFTSTIALPLPSRPPRQWRQLMDAICRMETHIVERLDRVCEDPKTFLFLSNVIGLFKYIFTRFLQIIYFNHFKSIRMEQCLPYIFKTSRWQI